MAVISHTLEFQVFLNYRGEQLRNSFVSHHINAFERNEINFFVNKYELRGKDFKNLFVRIQESRIVLAVFSTRGEELRNSFVSHLIDAFDRNEINFFVDKYEQRGKDLKNLFVRIQESRIALAIFSTRYAESRWPMDELVKMKKLADQRKLEVIPIFYKVEAEHVKEQKGEFGDNFWTLAKVSSGDQIKNWKEALESISEKMGLSLGDKSSEADFVKEIVKEVQRVIAAIRLEEKENHFGKRTRKDRKCKCNCIGLPVFKKTKTKEL